MVNKATLTEGRPHFRMITRRIEPAEAIRLRGVRQNNLQSIDCDVPLNRFTVITGVSGSGKSSLAFDTLYAEGERRYIETFSAYTRQLTGWSVPRPTRSKYPPAVAIDASGAIKTSCSTVGTLTGINDYGPRPCVGGRLPGLWPRGRARDSAVLDHLGRL